MSRHISLYHPVPQTEDFCGSRASAHISPYPLITSCGNPLGANLGANFLGAHRALDSPGPRLSSLPPMPSPDRFASITRRLEDLPSDGGAAVDTLAGALLRTFIRLNELEAALARLTRRVAVIEGGAKPAKEGDGATRTVNGRGN